MLDDLVPVYDTTLLTQSKTFWIDNTLYRYSHRLDSVKHPQYLFEPLPGQKKTATLKLNRNGVVRRVQEVPSLRKQHNALIRNGAIQQSLF